MFECGTAGEWYYTSVRMRTQETWPVAASRAEWRGGIWLIVLFQLYFLIGLVVHVAFGENARVNVRSEFLPWLVTRGESGFECFRAKETFHPYKTAVACFLCLLDTIWGWGGGCLNNSVLWGAHLSHVQYLSLAYDSLVRIFPGEGSHSLGKVWIT